MTARRDDFHGDWFFALRTFREDGTAVSTPIWLAPASGHWYGYTPGRSWKVQRIRRNHVVLVTLIGRPRWRGGPAVGPEIAFHADVEPEQSDGTP